jgi:hypothetical protein
MELKETHTSGAEEWSCPTCGRRMLVSWSPKFKRIVIEPGNENAIHSGGKGGLSNLLPKVSNPGPQPDDGPALGPDDHARLAPWADWLEGMGFDRLWDG